MVLCSQKGAIVDGKTKSQKLVFGHIGFTCCRFFFFFKQLVPDLACSSKTLSQSYLSEGPILRLSWPINLLYVPLPSCQNRVSWRFMILLVRLVVLLRMPSHTHSSYYSRINTTGDEANNILIGNINASVKIAKMTIFMMYSNSRHFVILNNKLPRHKK